MKRLRHIIKITSIPLLLVAVIVVMLCCSSSKSTEQQSRGILFFEDFENNQPFKKAYNIETGNWDYALKYVSDTVFRGTKAARFEIHKDQPLVKNSKRSEVTIIKGLPGANMWYSFAVYFPEKGFEIDSAREIINQWYQQGTPATSLRVRNDKIYLETGPTPEDRKQFDIGPATKNTWHQFVFHFIHDHGDSGLIEVWHNGEKVITHKGGNMYNNVLPKWKIGIYKAAFKFGTSARTHRVVYFDNIRVGDAQASYESMMPAGDR